jgi:hypothetical protein
LSNLVGRGCDDPGITEELRDGHTDSEYFVHQIPECLPSVAVHHHWRESYFYELHDPSGKGDAIYFTMGRRIRRH